MGDGKRETGNGGAYTGLGKKKCYIHDTGFLLFLFLLFSFLFMFIFLVLAGCRVLGIQSDGI